MMKSMRTARAEIKKNNSIIVVAKCHYHIDGHSIFSLNAIAQGRQIKSMRLKGKYKLNESHLLHFQEHEINEHGQLRGTIRKSMILE